MAASFDVVAQTPTVIVVSPKQVLDAELVEFITSPSGVIGQRVVPQEAWAAGGAEAWIAPVAQAIENLISGGLASYASFVQSVDPGTGLLTDAYAFIVTYDPADGRPVMSAVATVPSASLTLDTQFGGVLASYFGGGSASLDPAQTLRNVYDQLVATAGL